MIKKDINQNDISNSELLNIIDYNYIFNEKPINRIKTKPTLENLKSRLESLKNTIEAIENCDLKKKCIKNCFCRWKHAKPNNDCWRRTWAKRR